MMQADLMLFTNASWHHSFSHMDCGEMSCSMLC
jgi:hypothetical protein